MKLTKKIIAATVIALAARGAFAAVDSYIYWMVNDPVNLISGEATTFDYAKVSVDGGSTYLNWYQYNSQTGYSASFGDVMPASDGGTSTPVAYWGLFEYTPGMSFLFELYNEDGSLAGFLNTPWVSSSSIASGSSQSGLTPYVLTGVVPEPTSGLLSLFGLAALALRRRRRV